MLLSRAGADQDWKPVTLKKSNAKKPTTATGLDKALREGKVETVKKCESGRCCTLCRLRSRACVQMSCCSLPAVDAGNKQSSSVPTNAAKLEAETEDFKRMLLLVLLVPGPLS
jgi:hypothetical protein